MPSLDSCLNAVFEPGFIPADPGAPPAVPLFPPFGVASGTGAMSAVGIGLGFAITAGASAGVGAASALSNSVMHSVGTAAGTGAGAAVGTTAAVPPLDGLGATAAFSISRDLLTSFIGGTRYTTVSSAIDLVTDQTGNSRNLTQTTAGARPTVAAGGSNSRDAMSFDGSDDNLRMTGIALSTVITNSAGYIVVSCVVDAVSTNDTGSTFNNDALFHDSANFMGVFGLNSAGAHTLRGYNWDGNQDVPTGHSITTGASLVVEWKHSGGNVSTRINAGTANSTASGNTSTMTGNLAFGAKVSGTSQPMDVRIVEIAVFNTTLTGPQEDALVANFLAWMGP